MSRKDVLKKYCNFSNPKFVTLFYFVVFFFTISFYQGAFISDSSAWTVNIATFTHHLVDYSFGFCTKFLPGAIYHLFFKEVIPEQLNRYLYVLTFFFIVFLSYTLARVMGTKQKREDRKVLLFLFVFYITGPCTFSIYVKQFGMLDFYWLLFGGLFFFLVDKKYLKFIVPIVYVGTLLVHFSSIVVFIVLFSLILLYEAVSNDDKTERKRFGIIFAVSVIVVIALFLYFMINEKSNLVYDMEGFNREIYKRQRAFGGEGYYTYFDYAFYNFFDVNGDGINDFVQYPITHFFPNMGEKLPPALAEVSARILSQFEFNSTIAKDSIEVLIGNMLGSVFTIPIIVFSYMFYFHMIKESRGIKRFVFVCAAVQFMMTFGAGILSSVDFGRWISHAFLVQFTFTLYVIVREEKQLAWAKQKLCKIPYWAVFMYLPLYMGAYVIPYS